MDKEWMRRQLPERPPEGLARWAENKYSEELGGQYLIFKGERVPISPELEEIMEYNSLKPRRHEWAAYCTCTACEESFYTQKVRGLDAIRIAVGEDGMPYTLEPGEPYGTEAMLSDICVEEAFSGETMLCPTCRSNVEVIHSRKLRGGRTKRIMVQAVQNVAGYTTVLYWMIVRRIDEFGDSVSAEPMDAYVLTEAGGLVRYTHVERTSFGSYMPLDEWVWRQKCEDKRDSLYSDWGSINNKKSGAVPYEVCPDLEGTTGEKTGLPEFMEGGGFGLVQYLKFWRQHRNIENLVKSGQASLVAEIFYRANSYCYSIKAEMEKYVDLKEKKPHKMLRLSKEEFRWVRNRDDALSIATMDRFGSYKRAGGALGLPAFMDMQKKFGVPGIGAAISIVSTSGVDLDKLLKYLSKAGAMPGEVQWLVDYWRMAREVNGGRELTQEELWPRNLRNAHDRLNQIQEERRILQKRGEREALLGQFQKVIDRYGQLQWTDGELCILLPSSPEDLHLEGKILRHCVGGYSNRHISGSDTIFFVRHYRRPERSYYTLDIRMNQGEPKEIQLHGYGNEYHGPHKEHRHSIPRKVRDFVDRWKREVLIPWWVQQINSEKKEKTA